MNQEPLYLDNHLLVLCKPAGVLAQADETGDSDLLTLGKQFLKTHFAKPGKVYLGLVHRLDRPVSGLMVFARTSKAAARLSDQFRRGVPVKRYLALVAGTPPEHGHLEDYLLKENRKVRIVAANHPRGKVSSLRYRLLRSFGSRSLIEVVLETGRPHQIRIQFASRGFSLIGDMRYGANQRFDGLNLALHCYSLAIQHPIGERWMQWAVEPPPSWPSECIEVALNLIGEQRPGLPIPADRL